MYYIKIAVFLGALSLVGCGVTDIGNPALADLTQEKVQTTLVVGKTSKAEVRKALGEPVSLRILANKEETWMYSLVRESGRKLVYNRSLKVHFLPNGVLKDIEFENFRGSAEE